MRVWATGAEGAVTRHPGLACGIRCRVTARPYPGTRPTTDTCAWPNLPRQAAGSWLDGIDV